MVNTDPMDAGAEPGSARALGRDVAKDMAAIFGAGVRPPAEPSARPVVIPRRRSGLWVGLGLASALAAVVAAGVMTREAPQTTRIVRPVAPPVHASPPAAYAALPVAIRPDPSREARQVAPTPTPSPPPSPTPSPPAIAAATEPAPARRPSAEATDRPAPAAAAAPRQERPRPSPTAVAAAPPAPVRLQPAARPPAAALVSPVVRRDVCDEDDDRCLSLALERADRRLVAAFDQAEAAGVGARILRGYRREWDRARNQAADQPRNALWLYAMITSDLRTLAEEAAARDGDPPR